MTLQKYTNAWHRDTAARLLCQRQDRSIALVRMTVEKGGSPIARATALHLLDGLSALDERSVLGALDDQAADVRIQALRLAEKLVNCSPSLQARIPALQDDPDLNVRYQAAFTLGEVNSPAAADALTEIMLEDGADSWMRLAVLSSLGRNAAAVFQRLADRAGYARSSAGRGFLIMLARQIGAGGRESEVGVVLRSLARLNSSLRKSLVQALVEKQKGAARNRILSARAVMLRPFWMASSATRANGPSMIRPRCPIVSRLSAVCNWRRFNRLDRC